MDTLWIYLIAYALLLAAGWFILRVLTPRVYRRHGKLTRPAAAVQALLFFTFGGFPMIYLPRDWPAISVSLPQRILGDLVLFTGLGFTLYGIARLGWRRSVGRGGVRLKRTGLYGRSRNPQCIACGLYVIGFLILWPSGYALGWASLYPVLIHWMIRTEEAHLLHLHGEEYAEYCDQVPRYI